VTERLARASSRRPWVTIGAWAAAIVVSIFLVGALLDGVLSSEARVTGNPESEQAEQLIGERFPASEVAEQRGITEVVVVRGAPPDRASQLAADLREAGATNVVTPDQDERLVSADGDAFALLVGLSEPPEERVKDVVAVIGELDAEPGVEAGISGEWTLDADFQQLSQDDLRTGELFFGIPASLIVLLLVFGALVAGLVPLIFAIVSIVVALALTALIGQAFELSVFVVNMLTGMGLALGIDYTLFILSRYREERAQGREKLDAIATGGATASRAVLFSGLAFVLAMTGMLLVPSSIMRSLAAGAILVGIVSVVAALTLLPAVLSLLGDRVNAVRIPYFGRAVGTQSAQESRFWGRIVAFVMSRPVACLVVTVSLLVAAAIPIFWFETGSSGVSTLPDRFAAKQGFELLNEEFPGQSTDPVQIVVDGQAASPEVQQGIDRLENAFAANPLFGEPTEEANPAGDTTLIQAPLAGDAVSEPEIEAVRDLRTQVIPEAFSDTGAEVLVGGDTAIELEYHDAMDAWLPRVFTFVLGLSFILLAIAFRSIVVPATAIAMNLLAVGATYGILVLVFIKGIGNDVFGFEQVDHIEAWVPLFLFSVLFGLSMDYQVFLLSRIREKFSETGDNRYAIAFGVGSTARLITGAALIIIAVFWGFAMGDLIMFQQMGFGIAVALLIDATVIRSVVVPATMTLLGKWNWYLPSWLEWLPDVNVEGAEPRRPESARPAHAQSGSSGP
jgi:putative drug exporter of the RND superfamily